MTKRTNMDFMLESTMDNMMREVMDITMVKFALEVFKTEVTKNLAAARADEEYVEFEIKREGEFEKGFKLLLRKSGVREGRKYQDIQVDWMNYLNDVWKLDTKIEISSTSVSFEITNPIYYMLRK